MRFHIGFRLFSPAIAVSASLFGAACHAGTSGKVSPEAHDASVTNPVSNDDTSAVASQDDTTWSDAERSLREQMATATPENKPFFERSLALLKENEKADLLPPAARDARKRELARQQVDLMREMWTRFPNAQTGAAFARQLNMAGAENHDDEAYSAATHREFVTLVAELVKRFPNDPKILRLYAGRCDEEKGDVPECMRIVIKCLAIDPNDRGCQTDLRGITKAYTSPRCLSKDMRPSLAFRELLSMAPAGTKPTSISFRDLFSEVRTESKNGDDDSTSGFRGQINPERQPVFSAMTERLATTPGSYLLIVDGSEEKARIGVRAKMDSDTLSLDMPISAICSKTEQRKLPDDIAHALAGAK